MDFIFDLQRFALTELTNGQDVPENAIFSVTKVEGGETKTYYSTEASDFTTENLENATEIKLLKDITVAETVEFGTSIAVAKDVTVDFGNFKWTYTGTDYAVKVTGGTLNIKGGGAEYGLVTSTGKGVDVASGATFTVSDNGFVTVTTDNGIGVNNAGTVNVSGGGISAGSTGIKMNAGKLTITDGTIKGTTDAVSIANKGVTLNISNGTVGDGSTNALSVFSDTTSTATASSVTITGGTFNGSTASISDSTTGVSYSITGGSFKFAPTVTNTITSYTFNIDGNTVYNSTEAVPDSALFSIESGGSTKYFTTLTKAQEAVEAGGTVTLLKAGTIEETSITKQFTLDLKGFTLTGTGSLNIITGGNLTIKGDANGKFTNSGATSTLIYLKETGQFTLESGELEATSYAVRTTAADQTFTMKGGSIKNTAATFESGDTTYAAYGVLNGGGTVNMSGGTITASGYGVVNSGTFNMTGGEVKSGSSKFTIGSNSNYSSFAIYNAAATLNISGTAKVTGQSSELAIYNTGTVDVQTGGSVEAASTAIQSTGGSVKVSGGSVKGTTGIVGINGAAIELSAGSIECTGTYQAVSLGQNSKTYKPTTGDSFTMTGGTITATGDGAGVCLFNGGETFTMTGGTITAQNSFGISNNGKSYNKATTINISDESTITSTGAAAIYHAGVGTITIEGGKFTGESGLEIRAGTADITGGEFTANANTDFNYVSNKGGSTTAGAGIAVAQHTTKKELTVNISGANTKVTGAVAVAVVNPEGNDDNAPTVNIKGGTFVGTQSGAIYAVGTNAETTIQKVTDASGNEVSEVSVTNVSDSRVRVNVTGGYFTGALNLATQTDSSNTAVYQYDNGGRYDLTDGALFLDSKYLTYSGYKTVTQEVVEGEDGETITYYKIDLNGVVAKIGDKEYTNLQTAINDAMAATTAAGKEIKLVADTTYTKSAPFTVISGDVTIDLAGHTISGAAQGSAFKISKGEGATEAGKLTIKDSVGATEQNSTGGLISNTASSYDSLITVADGGTFTLASGTLQTKFNAIDLDGSTAAIKGGTITVTNTTSGADTSTNMLNAINVKGNSALTIGVEDDETAAPEINLTVSSNAKASAGANVIYTTAGTEDGKPTVTVYGGNISLTRNVAASPTANAVNICSGATLTVEGGKIETTNKVSTDKKSNVAVNLADTSTATFNAGEIKGATAGVTGTNNATAKFKVGFTLQGETAAEKDFVVSNTNSEGYYSFGKEGLTNTEGTNNWTYSYGVSTSEGDDNKYLGTEETVAFESNAITAENKDNLVITVTEGEGEGGARTVSIATKEGTTFTPEDGQYISIESENVTFATQSGQTIGGLAYGGEYYAADTFKEVTLEGEATTYKYFGQGTDSNGFIKDGSAEKLIYHTARTNAFEFSGNIDFADAITEDGITGDDVKDYFTIAAQEGDATKYDVTVKPSKLFKAVDGEAASDKTLKISTTGYTLKVDSTEAVEPFKTADFKPETATYMLSGGAVKTEDGLSTPTAGYADDGKGNVTYYKAAETFSFKATATDDPETDEDETYTSIKFKGDSEKPTNIEDWIAVSTDGTTKTITVKAAALATDQTDGAQLQLSDTDKNKYTLTFEGVVTDGNIYADTATWAEATGESYVYSTAGMTTANGYDMLDEDGKHATTGGTLTYHTAQKSVNLYFEGATTGTGEDAKPADATGTFATIPEGGKIEDYFGFDGTTLTIKKGSVISGMGNGEILKVNNGTGEGATQYKIALTENTDAAVTDAFVILDAAGQLEKKFENNVYTGEGAAKEGYYKDGDNYVHYTKQDTFTLDSTTNMAKDGADFITGITVVGPTYDAEGKVSTKGTITIDKNALNTTKGTIKLDIASAANYTLAMGDELAGEEAGEVSGAYFGNSTYVTEGAAEAGYALSTAADAITYVEKATEICFINEDGDPIAFDETNENFLTFFSYDSGTQTITVDVAAFAGTQPNKYATLKPVIYNDDGSEIAVNVTLKDGTNDYTEPTTITDSNSRTAATFTSGAYKGIGADKEGYHYDSTTHTISYYAKATEFTLATDDESASFKDNATDFFTLSEDGTTITLNSKVFATAPTYGKTVTITADDGGTYKLAVGDGLTAATIKDASFKTTEADGDGSAATTTYTYTVEGADVDGFVSTNNTTLTYTKQADTIEFEGNLFKTGTEGNGLANSDADMALFIKVADGKVSFTNANVLGNDTDDTGAYLTIKTEGYSFADSDVAPNLTTLGEDVVKDATTEATFTKGEDSVFTYKSAGASSAGLGISNDTEAKTSTITYYKERDYEFSFDNGTNAVTLVAPGEGEDVDDFITVKTESSEKVVTITAKAIDTASLKQGATLKLASAEDANYTLKLDTTGTNKLTQLTDGQANDKIIINATEGKYSGVGTTVEGGGFAVVKDDDGKATDSFTWYAETEGFTLASDDNNVKFAAQYKADAETDAVAWSEEAAQTFLKTAIVIEPATEEGGTSTIKFNNVDKLFDSDTLKDGFTLALKNGDATEYKLSIVDTAATLDSESDKATAGKLEADSSTYNDGYEYHYLYTFPDAWTKDGFETTDDAITYHEAGEKLVIASDIEFDLDAIGKQETGKEIFKVVNGGTNTVTIAKAALKLSDIQGTETITVYKLGDTQYSLALGDGLVPDTVSQTARLLPAEEPADGVYTWVSANGALANSVDVSIASNGTLTFNKVGDILTFEAKDVTVDTSKASDITYDKENSKITVGAGVVTGSTDGGTFALTSETDATVDFTAVIDGNEYHTVETFAQTTDAEGKEVANSYTYVGKGADEAGFTATTGNTKSITYHASTDVAKVITFDTSGGITFGTIEAGKVGEAIEVKGTDVTINKAALSAEKFYSNATLKISDPTSGYTLKVGDLTETTDAPSDATFNTGSGLFRTAGVDNAGFKAAEGTLTYYAQAKQITINATNMVFASNAKDHIYIIEGENSGTATVKFDPEAFVGYTSDAETKMEGDGTEYLTVSNVGSDTTTYTISTDGLTVTSDPNTPATFSGTEYKGVGAKGEGFILDDGKLTYYKPYYNFTLASDDDAITLGNNFSAENFTFTDVEANGSEAAYTKVTIKAESLKDLEGSFTSGSTLKIATSGYQFDQYGDAYTGETNKAASFSKDNSKYTFAGPTATGYKLEDGALTYYKEAEALTFKATGGASQEKITWATSINESAVINRQQLVVDATKNEVTIDSSLFDLSTWSGDGTEKISVESSDKTKTYKLTADKLAQAGDVTQGSFTASTGVITIPGATKTGFKVEDGVATYYKAGGSVKLEVKDAAGQAVTFTGDVGSDKFNEYFSFGALNEGKRTVTLTDEGIKAILGDKIAEGLQITVSNADTDDNTVYSLAFGESYTGAGTYTEGSFGTGEDLLKFTMAGVSGHEGFVADESSTGTYTYHNKSQVVNFTGTTATLDDEKLKAAGGLTVTSETTGTGGEAATTYTVKIAADAVTATNGQVLKLADTNWKFDTTVAGEEGNKTIGGLAYGGTTYNEQAVFEVTKGEGEDAVSTGTYKAAGADSTGFVPSDDGKTLTYGTAREAEFSLAVSGLTYKSNLVAATAAGAFAKVEGADGDTVTYYTVKPSVLFDNPTNGTVKVADDDSKFALKLDTTDTGAAEEATAFFAADTATYTIANSGAVTATKDGDGKITAVTPKAGYVDDGNGTITYKDQAQQFKFKVTDAGSSGGAKFTGLDADAFTVTPATTDGVTTYTVKLTSDGIAALNKVAGQAAGATLEIETADTANVKFTLSTDGFEEPASAKLEVKDAETKTYTFTADGPTENSFVKVTEGEGTDAKTSIVFQEKGTTIDLTSYIALETGNTTAITLNETTLTINPEAIDTSSTAANGATIKVNTTGYTLAYGGTDDKLSEAGTTVASFDSTTKKLTTAGATKAGYFVSKSDQQATNNDTITYYTANKEISFAYSDDIFADTITLTGDADTDAIVVDEDEKTITFKEGAFKAANLVSGSSVLMMDSAVTNYTVKFEGVGADGIAYSDSAAFVKSATDADGNYTYTYSFSGTTQNGFVKKSSTDAFYTYFTAGDTIKFTGNLEFSATATENAGELAGKFVVGTTTDENNKKTITIKNTDGEGSIFGSNADGATITLDDTSAAKYKLEIDSAFTPEAKGTETDTLEFEKESSGNTYTYKSTGISGSAGYKVESDKTLKYRALTDNITFDSEIALNETNIKAGKGIVIDGGTVTLTKDAFADEPTEGTLSITSFTRGNGATGSVNFTLALKEDDFEAWEQSNYDMLTEGNFVSKGYTKTGYKLEDNTVSYHVKNATEATFTNLAENATASMITLQEEGGVKTFKISKDAIPTDGKTVSVSNGFTLEFGDDVPSTEMSDSTTYKDNAVLDEAAEGSDTRTYHTQGVTAGYVKEDNTLKYITATAEGTSKAIEIKGLSDEATVDTVKVEDTTITISNLSALGKNEISAPDGYEFEFADGLNPAPVTTPAGMSGYEYKSASNTAGYEINATEKNKITYTEAKAAETLFFFSSDELNGAPTIDEASLNNKVVKVTNFTLKSGQSTITLNTDGDYTLALGENYTTTKPEEETKTEFGTVEDNKVTYAQTTTVKDYWKADSDSNNKKYTLTKTDDVVKELFTLEGVKSVTNITPDENGKVTLTTANLQDNYATADNFAVKLTKGTGADAATTYTLEITDASTDDQAETSYSWGTYNADEKTLARKTSTTTQDHWTIDDDSTTYTFVKGDIKEETPFTLKGVSSTAANAISFQDKDGNADNGAETIVLGANALNGEAVTFVGEHGAYKLALAEGIKGAEDVKQAEAFDGTTYKSSYYSEAAYDAAADGSSISYQAVTTPTDLFVLNGIATSNVTVSGDAENGYTVAVKDATLVTEDTTITVTGKGDVNVSITAPAGAGTVTEKPAASGTAYAWAAPVEGTATATRTDTIPAYWLQAENAKTKLNFYATSNDTSTFTLEGLKSDVTADALSALKPDASGTITASADLFDLTKDNTLKVSNGSDGKQYKLKIEGVTPGDQGDQTYQFSGTNGTYNYTSSYKKAYYTALDGDVGYEYHAAAAPTTFTISGLKDGLDANSVGTSDTSAIKIDGTKVIVNASAVDLNADATEGSNIQLSNGGENYTTLEIATALTDTETKGGNFTYAGSTYTYNGKYKDAHFEAAEGTPVTSYEFKASTKTNAKTFTISGLAENEVTTAGLNECVSADESSVRLTDSILTAAALTANNENSALTISGAKFDLTNVTEKAFGTAVAAESVGYDASTKTLTTAGLTGDGATAGYKLTDDTKVTYHTLSDSVTFNTGALVIDATKAATITVAVDGDGVGTVTLSKDIFGAQTATEETAFSIAAFKHGGTDITTYKLALAQGELLAAPTTVKEGFAANDPTTYYTAGVTAAGYEFDDADSPKSIIYKPVSSEEIKFSGFSAAATTEGNITREDTTFTINSADVFDRKAVSITGGDYGFKIDQSVLDEQSATTGNAGFDKAEGSATYHTDYNPDTYSVNADDSKTIDYKEAKPKKDLFTVSGIKTISDDNYNAETNTVTLDKDTNLNNADVVLTLAEGNADDSTAYKLAISGEYAPTEEAAGYSDVANNSVYYHDKYYSAAGYVKESDTKFTYESAKTAEDAKLFTITGVSTKDGIELGEDGKTVTVASTTISGNEVKVDGGDYALTLGGVKTSEEDATTAGTPEFVKGEGNTVVYSRTDTIGDYWTTADSGKTWTKTAQHAADPVTLFTITGVSTKDGISLGEDGKTVTVASTALSGNEVKVDGDYALTLGGVKTSEEDATTAGTPEFVKGEGNTVVYSRTDTIGDYWTTADSGKTWTKTAQHAADPETLFTISGLANTDGITVKDGVVTISAKNLDSRSVSFSGAHEGYSLAIADDITEPKDVAVGLEDGVYTKAGKTEGYTLKDDVLTYKAATTKTVEFKGLSEEATPDDITVAGSKVKITANAMPTTNGATVTIVTDGYSMVRDSKTMPQTGSVDETTLVDGVYTKAGTTSGYTVSEDGKSISYKAGTSKTVEFVGLSDSATPDDITVAGSKVKITANAMPTTNGATVTIVTDGYSMVRDSKTMPQAGTVDETTLVDGVYTKAGTTSGYTVSEDGKSISYKAGTSKTVEFVGLSDSATPDDITVAGNKVKVSANAMPTTNGATLEIVTDGYTLVRDSKTMPQAGTVDETTLVDGVYTKAGTTSGYTVSEDGKSISYQAGTSKTVEFKGLSDSATPDDITVAGNKVKVSANAMPTTNSATLEIVTDGYTLVRDSKTMPATSENVDETTLVDGVYTSAGTTGTYTLAEDGRSISYKAGTSKTVEFKGLSDSATPDDITVAGNKVKVSANAMPTTNGATLEIVTDGYTLVRDSKTMPTTSETVDETTLVDGVYTKAGTTGTYTLAEDGKSISYKAGTSKTVEFVGLSDSATVDDITVAGNKVKVSANAMPKTNGATLEIVTDGYTLVRDSKTMPQAETVDETTLVDGVYTKAGTTAGYTLSEDGKSISYKAGTSKTVEFVGLSDSATADDITVAGSKVKITANAMPKTNGATVEIATDGYTMVRDSKTMPLSTGSVDEWSDVTDGKISYLTGHSDEGYKVSSDGKSITFYEESEGSTALELSGVADSEFTAVSDGKVTLKLANFDTNLSVDSNAGDYKFSIAKDTYTGKTFTGSTGRDNVLNYGAELTINLGNGNDTIISSGANSSILGGAGNDNIKNNGGANVYIDGGNGSDYIQTTGTASTVLGGAGNDSIYGGTGNDSLRGNAGTDLIYGGAGADYINGDNDADQLYGDAGNDTVRGGAGNDTLWGGAGNDKLYGDAGDDVFVYKPGEGTDTIYDYESGDMLLILKADGTEGGTFDSATFASNKLTLSINGGGSVVFSGGLKNDSTVNINNKTYTVSGSTIK